MTSNMDFLMKLYLMNFVNQQQKVPSGNLLNAHPGLPLADPIANSNYIQQLFLQKALESMQNTSDTNLYNQQINNSLFSSTVSSTPKSSFNDSDNKTDISSQHASSSNNFSTPSSISSNDKSSLLMDAELSKSPIGVSYSYKCSWKSD